jgi:hypothetical protein
MKCRFGPSVPAGNRRQLQCRPPTSEFRPGRRPRSTQWTWRHHRRICNSNWPSISDMCQVRSHWLASVSQEFAPDPWDVLRDIFSALIVNESTTPCTTWPIRGKLTFKALLWQELEPSVQVIGQDSPLAPRNASRILFLIDRYLNMALDLTIHVSFMPTDRVRTPSLDNKLQSS